MLNSKFSLQDRIFAAVANFCYIANFRYIANFSPTTKIQALQTTPFLVFLLSTLIVIVLVGYFGSSL